MSNKGDFLSPLREFPQRVRDAFTDPLRLRNIIGSVVERCMGILAALIIGVFVSPWWLSWSLGCLAGVLFMLAVYEFVLEPLGLVGHYWERGPRDGEEFKNP